MRYIVALDQGTTSSRAIVFDEKANTVASHSILYRQIYPKPGWVEHDPYDILNSQLEALKIAVGEAKIDVCDIVALGITNQRETTILWEKDSGKPVYNAIVWQCRRTAPYVERIKQQGLDALIRKKTGLVPDAYFCATKLQWIFDNVPGARERAQRGELLFGTVDSWLVWNLTKGQAHVTDVSNASRTMLFNIHTMDWDEELLRLFDIPRAVLPRVCDTSGVVGKLDAAVLGKEIPIASMVGDQQAALFGQACYDEGAVKITYGTGGFLLMNTGETAKDSKNGLLTTVAWRYGGRTCYALEGSIFVAGAAIQWLRDELGLIQTAAETEGLALSVTDNAGVYMVPAFTGLGAPYWDMYGRGVIVGLTRGAGKAHLVRATLESIAYQAADVVEAMEQDSGMPLKQLRVDGGASANNFLTQFQADILNIEVVRPQIVETTALGAAYFAGLAVGLWQDEAQLKTQWQAEGSFVSRMDESQRLFQKKQWKRAVERAAGWEEND